MFRAPRLPRSAPHKENQPLLALFQLPVRFRPGFLWNYNTLSMNTVVEASSKRKMKEQYRKYVFPGIESLIYEEERLFVLCTHTHTIGIVDLGLSREEISSGFMWINVEKANLSL